MDIVKRALEIGAELGADEIEVFYGYTEYRSVSFENKIMKPYIGISKGLAVRVAKDKNIGFSYTYNINEDSIRDTIKIAISAAKSKDPDPNYAGLPSTKSIESDYVSNDIADVDLDFLSQILDNVYSSLKNFKKAVPIGGGIDYLFGEYRIVNTNGVDSIMRANNIDVSFYVLTKEIPPNFSAQFISSKKRDIDIAEFAAKIKEKVDRIYSAKDIDYMGEPTVVFSPYALNMMLMIFIRQVMAPTIKEGMSPYTKEDIGKKIASENLTMIDDPRNTLGIFPSDVDMEGIPTQCNSIIESGVLKNVLTDYYHAKLLGLKPTGNAVRISEWGNVSPIEVYPSVYPWFLSFGGKEKSYDDIIRSIDDGFLVESVMGVHQSDIASGKFAVPSVAVRIKNGEIAGATRKLMLSGKFSDILNNVECISREKELGYFGLYPYLVSSGVKASSHKPPLKYRLSMKIANILLRLGIIKF